MSISPHFVADPQQWIKRGCFDWSSTTTWEVGDRLWDESASYPYDTWTYECDVAGTSPLYTEFNPNGASTYNYGTSHWTKITVNSWATASPVGRPSLVNYVDCNAEMAATQDGSCVVYVEPSTMRPRTGRVCLQGIGGWSLTNPAFGTNGPCFFGPLGMSHYHGRVRFGEKREAGPIDTYNDLIDSEGPISYTNGPDESARGWKIRQTTAGNRIIPTKGTAITFDNSGGSASSASLPTTMYDTGRRFGIHVIHNNVGSVWAGSTGSYGPRGQFLYRTPDAYVSDNSFTPQEPSMQGSLCALLRQPATYRNGAASGGDPSFSFLFGGGMNANFGSLWMSPFIYLHNTLTGSRTVTLHFLTDSPRELDIYNTDIWFDLFYPSSNTTPKYSHASNENTNWGAPACTKTAVTADSGQTWTAPTIYFPTAFKLSLTVTIQRAGILMLRVNVASFKISRHILFMCPYIDVA